MRRDVAVLGTGPAGLSAAINALQRNKTVSLYGPPQLSDKVVRAPEITNYLGLGRVTGPELADHFKNHLELAGLEVTPKRVVQVFAMGDYYALQLNDQTFDEATSVILATGVQLGGDLPGEDQLLGKGVSYCATCDAALYRGKKVAVVGYNSESIEDANLLAEMVDQVYFVPYYQDLKGLSEKVQVLEKGKLAILGQDHVEGLQVGQTTVPVSAVFIIRDAVSPGHLVPGLETEGVHVLVDRQGQTNLPGLFAAGDLVGRPYQYMKAAGEGLVAGLAAADYVSKLTRSSS